jgi:subtilisin family serine protease
MLAGALLLGATLVATGQTAAPVGSPDGRHAVSLITGDTVLLGPAGSMQVTPVAGKGREGMRFVIDRDRDHLYVIPDDALSLVAQGKLDRQLFDVDLLDKDGYGGRGDLPLIVQGGAGSQALAGTRNVQPLSVIDGAALRVAKGDNTFWRAVASGDRLLGEVQKVWLDGKLHLLLDRSVPQIGGPDAWKAGYTGKGVKVAVLDSGVDAAHPDLVGNIAAQKNFTTEPDTDDLGGHGTHVAATVASHDSVYRGVAPDASLIIGKVCLKDGRCDISAMLEAMEWASTEQHAKVVNISAGGPDEPGSNEPLEEAINRLTAKNGTLFVLGAGNFGDGGEYTVASPSTADAALSVGAVDRDDSIPPFSSQGPRLGDYAIKPDITAPGVGIVAARSRDGYLGLPGEPHMTGTGTSMSSPHVAGAAALMFQEHPDWTPAQVKAALMASATPTAGASPFRQGAGRVDLTRAIMQQVVPEQPSISFGKAQWPHNDDPITKHRLTYRNTGKTDVPLKLTVSTTGPDGTPATIFTLSTTSLTVPAGGTASVDVAADTRGNHPDGDYTGAVVATGPGGTAVRTPVAVVREVESYDVTVDALDRAGKPAANFMPRLGSYAGAVTIDQTANPDGSIRFRAPRGRYVMDADIAGDGGTHDIIMMPWLDLSADRKITVDARATKPIKVGVEREDATMASSVTGAVTMADDGGTSQSWTEGGDLSKVRAAQLGADAPADRFAGVLGATLAAPGADKTFTDSPYVYHLALFTPGTVFTGSHQVLDSDLATVRTENLAQGKGNSAFKGSIAVPTKFPGLGVPAPPLPITLPFTREELFSVDDVTWTTVFQQGSPDPDKADAQHVAIQRSYQKGTHDTERWNGAVFGPSLPEPGDASWARQDPLHGNVRFQVPMFSSYGDTEGESKTDTAHIIVYRNGTRLCETNAMQCETHGITPPPGRYRVETEATRGWTDLSTKVSVVWEVTNDKDHPAMPAQVVRFTPALDATNSAPGNRVVEVPVSVQRNPGAKPADVASLRVQVSFDHGAHWRHVPVVNGKAVIHHPASGNVSLRAKATDTDGNTVEQTIIDAYHVR